VCVLNKVSVFILVCLIAVGIVMASGCIIIQNRTANATQKVNQTVQKVNNTTSNVTNTAKNTANNVKQTASNL